MTKDGSVLTQMLFILLGGALTGGAGTLLNHRLGLTGWSQFLLPLFMIGIVALASSAAWPLRQRIDGLEAALRRLEVEVAEKKAPPPPS